MKLRKKKGRLLLVGCLLLILVTGCEMLDRRINPEQKSTIENEAVLKIALWGSSGEEKALKEAAEGIEREVKGVKSVIWEQFPSVEEFYDMLPTEAKIGKIPDIVILNNEKQKTLITSGLLEPLDEIPNPDQYMGKVLEEWMYDGQLYGMPISAAPALFIINQDLWEQAGLVDYPTTWEEVYIVAKDLKEHHGFRPLCLDIGNLYHVTQYLLSFGGGWNESTGMNTIQNQNAIAYILKLFDEGLAVTALDERKTWDGEVFTSKKCAMSTGGTWYIGALKEAPDINYTIIPMPYTDKGNGKTIHSYGISVMSKSENKEIAKEAIKFLARQEAQEIRMKVTGDFPSLISLQKAYYEKYPELSFIKEDIKTAIGFNYPVDLSILEGVQERLEQRIYGKSPNMTPEDILTPKLKKKQNN